MSKMNSNPSLEEIELKLLDDYAKLTYKIRFENDNLDLLPGDVKLAREKMIQEAISAIEESYMSKEQLKLIVAKAEGQQEVLDEVKQLFKGGENGNQS